MRARILYLAVLLAFAVGPADAQPITLKFSHFLGPTSFFQLDVVEPWAKELEAKTNGKVKVEIHDGTSPLGKVAEQASKAQAGAVDIALGLRGAEGDRFPGSSIIELPFLVPSAALGSLALWTLYKEGVLADEYKDYKVLALFVHNPGLIHTTSKRVVTPSDLKGLRLRAPNKTVAAALEHVGAVPVVLQVDDVMPAVKEGKIDGIVTNWGNPLQGFNDYMKFHTDTQFYTSAFFVVMNRSSYDRLPADARDALDSISGDAWVAKFGPYWDKWDKPVRDRANAPGHEVVVPDQATMAQWKAELKPVTERYLATLGARFANARDLQQAHHAGGCQKLSVAKITCRIPRRSGKGAFQPLGKPAELHRVNRRTRNLTSSDHKTGWLLDGS
jgi:TRAP-type C4-dicarboxylate transport system substrate-binding protein